MNHSNRYTITLLSLQGEPRILKRTDCQRVALEFARATQRALANQYGRMWNLRRRVAVYDAQMSPGSYVSCDGSLIIQGVQS